MAVVEVNRFVSHNFRASFPASLAPEVGLVLVLLQWTLRLRSRLRIIWYFCL